MRIAVFGGTAGVGLSFARQASPAHSLAVLARDPAKLAGLPVRAVAGNIALPGSEPAVDDVLRGAEAVFVSLGARMGDPAPGQAEVCSAGQARIMEALARRWAAEPWQGKLRMVVVTSIGCGATKGDIPERVYSFLEPALRDKDLQEALLFHLGQPLASAIEWSIVRPGGLTDDPPRGYRSAPGGIRGVTTRADAAAYCLAVLEGREPAGNAAVSVISI